MKTLINISLAVLAAFMIPGLDASAVSIVPKPQQIRETRSQVLIPEKFAIYGADASLKDLAKTYIESLDKQYPAGTEKLETGFQGLCPTLNFLL